MAEGLSQFGDQSQETQRPTAGRRRTIKPSADARGVLFLVNPTAGVGRKNLARTAMAAAEEYRFQIDVAESFEQLAEKSAEMSAAGRLRAVVTVGGDGTVGAALNTTSPGVPLAIVPAGTENLLAKYLGCYRSPGELGKLLEEGVVVRFDAGRASREGADDRLFTLMVSAGLDAAVVRQVHSNRRGNITHLAYAKPIFDTLRRYKYPPMQVTWVDPQGQEQQTQGRWVFGVNLPRYAQNLQILPEANGLDGLIDFRVFQRSGTVAGLWYFWRLLRETHHRLKSVVTVRGSRFRIESPEAEIPYQLDGDPGGVLPVEISAVPERLSLIVPLGTAQNLGFETSDPRS